VRQPRCPCSASDQIRSANQPRQSVRTTERGGVRGFNGHKLVRGRKRHILVGGAP